MTPLFASVLVFVGLLVIYLIAIPGTHQLDFTSPDSPFSIRDRMQKALHSAGIFDKAPSVYIIGILAAIFALGTFLVLYFGSIWAFIPAPIVVLGSTQIFLINRQRQFINRAHDELIPFLNRISTSVSAKKPIQKAYMDAVVEADVLKDILSDSAAKIASGSPFAETLVETIPILPLRMWAVFVRQLELYSETGGDVGASLDATIKQVNQMISLQAEARADYATQAKSQQIILIVPIAMILAWMFIVPDGASTMALLVTTSSGIIGGLVGLSLIIFGMWFLNKQMREIQARLAF